MRVLVTGTDGYIGVRAGVFFLASTGATTLSDWGDTGFYRDAWLL